MRSYDYDLFICHASADKEDVARPLAKLLTAKKKKVLFDELTIKVGDTLRRTIEKGLDKSRYGIVILSKAFFEPQWTEDELNALVQRDLADGTKVVLPVWHKLTGDDVREYSAKLADRLGANTDLGLEPVAEQIMDAINETRSGVRASAPVTDDLTLAKQLILTVGLKNGVINVFKGAGQRYVRLGKNSYNGSERQKKLFLHALKELIGAGLVEHVSGITYELTYPGIQAADRMPELTAPEKIGL